MNNSEVRRTALVTGASSGIGAAFAEVFASEGFDLVITARRETRLQELADRLTRDFAVRVHVIPADLTAQNAATLLHEELRRAGITADVLVNSAGFGVAGGYTAPDWARHEEMLRLMVVSMSELTYRLLPAMIANGYGRIVNVASTAGLAPSGAGTMYGAAKTFVVNFSESLGREVSRFGVHVTAVCPGLTRTEFHSDPALAATVKAMPRWMWTEPQDVARQGFDAVMRHRAVCIPGSMNRLTVAVLRHAPMSVLRRAARLALSASKKSGRQMQT